MGQSWRLSRYVTPRAILLLKIERNMLSVWTSFSDNSAQFDLVSYHLCFLLFPPPDHHHQTHGNSQHRQPNRREHRIERDLSACTSINTKSAPGFSCRYDESLRISCQPVSSSYNVQPDQTYDLSPQHPQNRNPITNNPPPSHSPHASMSTLPEIAPQHAQPTQ